MVKEPLLHFLSVLLLFLLKSSYLLILNCGLLLKEGIVPLRVFRAITSFWSESRGVLRNLLQLDLVGDIFLSRLFSNSLLISVLIVALLLVALKANQWLFNHFLFIHLQ